MTWKELVEKAKVLGYGYYNSCDLLVIENKCGNEVCFSQNGEVSVGYDSNCCDTCLAENRTYEQMYQIMLLLKED